MSTLLTSELGPAIGYVDEAVTAQLSTCTVSSWMLVGCWRHGVVLCKKIVLGSSSLAVGSSCLAFVLPTFTDSKRCSGNQHSLYHDQPNVIMSVAPSHVCSADIAIMEQVGLAFRIHQLMHSSWCVGVNAPHFNSGLCMISSFPSSITSAPPSWSSSKYGVATSLVAMSSRNSLLT